MDMARRIKRRKPEVKLREERRPPGRAAVEPCSNLARCYIPTFHFQDGRVGFVACVLLSFLFWRFRLSSAWCFAFRRVGFLEEHLKAARAC